MDDTQSPISADAPASAQDALEPISAAPTESVSDTQARATEAAALPAEPAIVELPPPPLLKLVGVGGAGVNIVSRISTEPFAREANGTEGLALAVMDCDARKLGESPVGEKWLLGEVQRRGLSTGGELELGRQAAEASRDSLASAGGGADLLFLVAGLGGGTGSAAAPLVAAEATKAGGLVIGFAVLPFSFEGGRRAKQAEAALVSLRRACDAVIVLPNDLLLQETSEAATALSAFEQADEWIARAVRALWRLLCKTGLMNVDFAALQRAFEYRGSKTVFGLGFGAGVGERRTSLDGEVAALATAGPPTPDALADHVLASLRACPLMHAPETARRADRLLVSVAGGSSVLTLSLVNRLVQSIGEQFGRSAELIVGATLDDSLGDRVELCLIGSSDIGNTSKRKFVTSANSETVHDRAPATRVARNTPSPQSRGRREEASVEISENRTSTKSRSDGMRAPKLPRGKLEVVTDHQGEFGFSAEAERGYFRDTEATLFDGQDLDPPTYLRKGVKIAVN